MAAPAQQNTVSIEMGQAFIAAEAAAKVDTSATT